MIINDHIRVNTAVVTVFDRNTSCYMAPYYDEIRSATGTRKWFLIIIVDVRCTLLYAYIVYGPKRHSTELADDRKRLVYPRIRHGEVRS